MTVKVTQGHFMEAPPGITRGVWKPCGLLPYYLATAPYLYRIAQFRAYCSAIRIVHKLLTDSPWRIQLGVAICFKGLSGNTKTTVKNCGSMEAPPRFELGHRSFADFCLTTWLWRHYGGGFTRNRTKDTRIFNPLLYRLSYPGSMERY